MQGVCTWLLQCVDQISIVASHPHAYFDACVLPWCANRMPYASYISACQVCKVRDKLAGFRKHPSLEETCGSELDAGPHAAQV